MMDAQLQKKVFQLIGQVMGGDLSTVDLTCPFCGKDKLVFSFTRLQPRGTGLFLCCNACENMLHFAVDGVPKNFREDLILEEYQQMEDSAARHFE